MTEEAILAQAMQKNDLAVRAAFLDAACAGNPALRARVEQLIRSHSQPEAATPGPALDARATGAYTPTPDRANECDWAAPNFAVIDQDEALNANQQIGRYKFVAQARRGRHGRRLVGRTAPAGRAAGGPQAHQSGHGFGRRCGPVCSGAPGLGDDGPSEHRQGSRCRNDRPTARRTLSWNS